MVKGVNKSVIEISETGNEMFEKVILYVAPEYCNASDKKLRDAAEELIEDFENTCEFTPVNKQNNAKKLGLLICAASAVFMISLFLFLIF